MIENLNYKQVFVFGSNLAGHHAGGAALQAKEKFGAVEGVGEGVTGRCYAFPTLDEDMKRRDVRDLVESVRNLYDCCRDNSDKEFLLTKVGCGIAGYKESFMKSLFKNPPKNLIVPNQWKH
jgi:hypothetical protein